MISNAASAPATPRRGWRHPNVLMAAGLAVAAGFAQFGVTATLADVAAAFGETVDAGGIRAQVGLSGTVLGVGLGVIRLASLGALPLTGLADHLGRRRVAIATASAGLALTVVAAGAPSYWTFVAIFALGRPLLTATNAIAGVIAAEETRTADRSTALAIVTAGYGLGAGLVATIRAPLGDDASFRLILSLALVPLLAMPFLARGLSESARYRDVARSAGAALRRRLGAVPEGVQRRRVTVLACLALAVTLVTGPINTFLFVYAESVLGASRGQTALVVVLAAPVGLVGLAIGRTAADRLGRRLTAGVAQVLLAVAGVLTYSGTLPAFFVGYLASICFGAAYGPAMAALSAELFPTRTRATAAGWLTVASVVGAVIGLVAFGAASDALDSFTGGAVLVSTPVALAAAGFALVPETRGRELDAEEGLDEQEGLDDAAGRPEDTDDHEVDGEHG